MDSTTNALNWFEIPALDIERSKKFYETIFGIKMIDMVMDDFVMAMFPTDPENGKASGALVVSEMHKPSMEGALIYLNANPDMSPVLAKVEAAGGTILMPKTSLGEHGNMALVKDTEGNTIGIHSLK